MLLPEFRHFEGQNFKNRMSISKTLSNFCFGSPLKIGSKTIGYWLDRQGKLLSLFLKKQC